MQIKRFCRKQSPFGPLVFWAGSPGCPCVGHGSQGPRASTHYGYPLTSTGTAARLRLLAVQLLTIASAPPRRVFPPTPTPTPTPPTN